VTASLRLCDGAIVVVDCLSGVCIQTQTVLKQAIAERVYPVLFINKLDRMFELQMDAEEAYHKLSMCVENVNVLLETLTMHTPVHALNNLAVYPQAETVAFGSGTYFFAIATNSYTHTHTYIHNI
jgi:elongation factor 2